jgi:transcriptional regulator with XRE-family HTH domain
LKNEAAMNSVEVGRRLKARRELLKLSQRDVAEVLGISPPGYGHWETGRTSITVDDLDRISKILKVKVSYFFDEAEFEHEGNVPTLVAFYDDLPPGSQDDLIDIARVLWEKKRKSEPVYGRKSDDDEPIKETAETKE